MVDEPLKQDVESCPVKPCSKIDYYGHWPASLHQVVLQGLLHQPGGGVGAAVLLVAKLQRIGVQLVPLEVQSALLKAPKDQGGAGDGSITPRTNWILQAALQQRDEGTGEDGARDGAVH